MVEEGGSGSLILERIRTSFWGVPSIADDCRGFSGALREVLGEGTPDAFQEEISRVILEFSEEFKEVSSFFKGRLREVLGGLRHIEGYYRGILRDFRKLQRV